MSAETNRKQRTALREKGGVRTSEQTRQNMSWEISNLVKEAKEKRYGRRKREFGDDTD